MPPRAPNERPIAVFDLGVGGLTVLQGAARRAAPRGLPLSRRHRPLPGTASAARRSSKAWRSRSARARKRAAAEAVAIPPARPATLNHFDVAQQHSLFGQFVEKGGIEPGTIPPISAWCARLAVKNNRFVRSSCTGVTTVTSGRCAPPRYGSLVRNTSPGRIVAFSAITERTVSLVCRGGPEYVARSLQIAGRGEKRRMKSKRSFTFTLLAVFRRVFPSAAQWPQIDY